jgi:hypothetical protein
MERPLKCITVEEAKALQKNWKDTRGKEIERAQKYEDTREFWYSIAELEEYIKYVKEKSSEQGINNPGLRIYLGAYPSRGQKKGLTNIFISPTTDEVAERSNEEDEVIYLNNYSIEPLNESQNGWPPREY